MVDSSKKIKFLTADQIEQAIDDAIEIASYESIHIVLAGGVAAQLFGSDRLTKDVDFLASGTPTSSSGLTNIEQLSFGGVRGLTKHGVEVDMIVRDDEFRELYEAALHNAFTVEGLPVLVVRPEYLMGLKLVAGRPKDEIDLKSLIKNNVDVVKKAHSIIKQFLGAYAAKEFDAYRQMAAWEQQLEREGGGK